MATEIVKNMSPRLPPLHRYAQHLEDILEPKPMPAVRTCKHWAPEDFEVILVVLLFLFLLCFGLALP